MCTTCHRRQCGAADDACSCVWAIFGSFDTRGLSYGPIGVVVLLGSGGRCKEGSRNVGGAAAIGAVNYANAGVSGHPMWDLVQPGRRE